VKRARNRKASYFLESAFKSDSKQDQYRVLLSFEQLLDNEKRKFGTCSIDQLRQVAQIQVKLSKVSYGQAIAFDLIREYGQFPSTSPDKFPKPPATLVDEDANWGRIRVTSVFRYIGHIVLQEQAHLAIFYVLFIDPHHEFFPKK
jgi:hypothetical protein